MHDTPCSGACSCAGGNAAPLDTQSLEAPPAASVNGVALHAPGDAPGADELRQRACTELLRQEAQATGLLATDDFATGDGSISEAAQQAIERLLDQAVEVPAPSREACRRYHAAHAQRFGPGERVRARHILFAVTPGVDVNALRGKAEAMLMDLRCQPANSDRFAQQARQWSNCPSSQNGGDLGWLRADECASEFAREVFGQPEVGVLPRLVHSRFGLHIVEVQEREPGETPAFEQVETAVAQALQHQAWLTAVRQYLMLLAGRADLIGVDLAGSDTPLVQ